MRNDITIRPETRKDYKYIIDLVLRSFKEGTDYSDGTDVMALVEEIRESHYYINELSFVAELDGKIVGHFMFSSFMLSPKKEGGHGGPEAANLLLLAPVAVHADFLRQGIGEAMLMLGIERAKEYALKKGFKGILLEGNFLFYNRVGFKTSADYGIYPTCGKPLEDERFMMCQETYENSLEGVKGYAVYDMYENA